MKKLTLAFVLVAAAALLVVAVGSGALSSNGEKKLSAKLTAKAEVPAPAGVPAAARGTFTGTLKGKTVTFKLTFSGLSGPAAAAHIHLGKPGKAGNVLVPLCGPCKSGVKKTMTVSSAARNAIERNGAYVNIHTAKNQAGEIRGQVKATDA